MADLRHSYASVLVEQGAHPKEMAELMGHSSVQITLEASGCGHGQHRIGETDETHQLVQR